MATYRQEHVHSLLNVGVALAFVPRGGRVDGQQKTVLLQQLDHHRLRMHPKIVTTQLHVFTRFCVRRLEHVGLDLVESCVDLVLNGSHAATDHRLSGVGRIPVRLFQDLKIVSDKSKLRPDNRDCIRSAGSLEHLHWSKEQFNK